MEVQQITAADMYNMLQSLGAPTVITKNKTAEGKNNYKPRPRHPQDMLDGVWRSKPTKVSSGSAFALHFVERERGVWLGDYQGAVEDRVPGYWSLIVANVKRFEVTDLDFSDEAQSQLESILKQNGPVIYSYLFPADAQARTATGDGPACSMREVKQRTKQQEFRNAVFAHHGARCKVTGCSVAELLEAAHLEGRNWERDNDAKDGIPLRVDVHRAYDSSLIKLDSEFAVSFMDESLLGQYGKYWKR